MNFSNLTDFDETGHPELFDIFRGIDVGIAAIIASDPTLKRKPPIRRKRSSTGLKAGNKRSAGKSRRQVA